MDRAFALDNSASFCHLDRSESKQKTLVARRFPSKFYSERQFFLLLNNETGNWFVEWYMTLAAGMANRLRTVRSSASFLSIQMSTERRREA